MGVDHGGTGDKSTRTWSWGRLCNLFPRFCHIGTNRSVLWPSKYDKIRFRPGLCLEPCWWRSRRSPDPLVGWGGDTSPIPYHTRHRLTFSACRASSPRIPARSTPVPTGGKLENFETVMNTSRRRCAVSVILAPFTNVTTYLLTYLLTYLGVKLPSRTAYTFFRSAHLWWQTMDKNTGEHSSMPACERSDTRGMMSAETWRCVFPSRTCR